MLHTIISQYDLVRVSACLAAVTVDIVGICAAVTQLGTIAKDCCPMVTPLG